MVELTLFGLCELLLTYIWRSCCAVLDHELTINKGAPLEELLLDEREDLLACIDDEDILLQGDVNEDALDHQQGFHGHIGDLAKQHATCAFLLDVGAQNNHLLGQALCKA